MKKYFLIVFCSLLFVVTGCGNKNQMTCTGTVTESGMEIKAKVIADFDNNDKLTDASIVYDLGNSDTANQWCTLFKYMEDAEKGITVKCSGSKITINGYAKLDSEDEDEEDTMIGKTKEQFKKAMEESSEGQITCK